MSNNNVEIINYINICLLLGGQRTSKQRSCWSFYSFISVDAVFYLIVFVFGREENSGQENMDHVGG